MVVVRMTHTVEMDKLMEMKPVMMEEIIDSHDIVIIRVVVQL
jgi:hypothetical protein